MILPDVNLLLYAYNPESPFRAEASAWWLETMNSGQPVILATPVALGFVRLATQASVYRVPLPVGSATAIVREWIDWPSITLTAPEPDDAVQALALLDECGTAGNLVSDALLAALALRHDAVVYSADSDFSRFRPMKWRNPLRD